MRLLLVFLLLISMAYGLNCTYYASILKGPKEKISNVPRMRTAPLGENLSKTCQKSDDHCTMYYYWVTGNEENYIVTWADCWNRDKKFLERCDVHQNGEDLGSGYKAYIVGCACNTDDCMKAEEAEKNWDEKLKLLGDVYDKDKIFAPKAPPTTAQPEETADSGGSPVFSMSSVLFATVLVVFSH